MAIPRYVESGRLEDELGHKKGVTSLAFSANGSYLASGGLDAKVCIWSTSMQKLLHSVKVSVAVLSLDWGKRGEDFLLCGLDDGTLVSIVLTPVCELSPECTTATDACHSKPSSSKLSGVINIQLNSWL